MQLVPAARSLRNRTDDETQRIDDCAAAYDEAIKRNPYFADFYDMKAEMLALASRYDDARKACKPPAWKGKPPINLRGRAAWVKSQEGEFDAAKTMMCATRRTSTANWITERQLRSA